MIRFINKYFGGKAKVEAKAKLKQSKVEAKQKVETKRSCNGSNRYFHS
jgi:hypothetical protein